MGYGYPDPAQQGGQQGQNAYGAYPGNLPGPQIFQVVTLVFVYVIDDSNVMKVFIDDYYYLMHCYISDYFRELVSLNQLLVHSLIGINLYFNCNI